MSDEITNTKSQISKLGLVLTDDLIFSSRITATARSLGLAMASARDAQALVRLSNDHQPACVIVDLANPGLDITTLVTSLKSAQPSPTIVAYGSHVDTATLKKAREAGCDLVLPRSKFVETLEGDMRTWFGQTGA